MEVHPGSTAAVEPPSAPIHHPSAPLIAPAQPHAPIQEKQQQALPASQPSSMTSSHPSAPVSPAAGPVDVVTADATSHLDNQQQDHEPLVYALDTTRPPNHVPAESPHLPPPSAPPHITAPSSSNGEPPAKRAAPATAPAAPAPAPPSTTPIPSTTSTTITPEGNPAPIPTTTSSHLNHHQPGATKAASKPKKAKADKPSGKDRRSRRPSISNPTTPSAPAASPAESTPSHGSNATTPGSKSKPRNRRSSVPKSPKMSVWEREMACLQHEIDKSMLSLFERPRALLQRVMHNENTVRGLVPLNRNDIRRVLGACMESAETVVHQSLVMMQEGRSTGHRINISDVHKEQALHRACEAGSLDDVKHSIEIDRVAPNSRTHDRQTPLGIAVFNQHTHIAKYLLEIGAEVNERSGPFQLTPLHLAVLKDDLELITLLIKHGAKRFVVGGQSEMQGTVFEMAELSIRAWVLMEGMMGANGKSCQEERLEHEEEQRRLEEPTPPPSAVPEKAIKAGGSPEKTPKPAKVESSVEKPRKKSGTREPGRVARSRSTASLSDMEGLQEVAQNSLDVVPTLDDDEGACRRGKSKPLEPEDNRIRFTRPAPRSEASAEPTPIEEPPRSILPELLDPTHTAHVLANGVRIVLTAKGPTVLPAEGTYEHVVPNSTGEATGALSLGQYCPPQVMGELAGQLRQWRDQVPDGVKQSKVWQHSEMALAFDRDTEFIIGNSVNAVLNLEDKKNVWNKHRNMYRYLCDKRERQHICEADPDFSGDVPPALTLVLRHEMLSLTRQHSAYARNPNVRLQIEQLPIIRPGEFLLTNMQNKAKKQLQRKVEGHQQETAEAERQSRVVSLMTAATNAIRQSDSTILKGLPSAVVDKAVKMNLNPRAADTAGRTAVEIAKLVQKDAFAKLSPGLNPANAQRVQQSLRIAYDKHDKHNYSAQDAVQEAIRVWLSDPNVTINTNASMGHDGGELEGALRDGVAGHTGDLGTGCVDTGLDPSAGTNGILDGSGMETDRPNSRRSASASAAARAAAVAMLGPASPQAEPAPLDAGLPGPVPQYASSSIDGMTRPPAYVVAHTAGSEDAPTATHPSELTSVAPAMNAAPVGRPRPAGLGWRPLEGPARPGAFEALPGRTAAVAPPRPQMAVSLDPFGALRHPQATVHNMPTSNVSLASLMAQGMLTQASALPVRNEDPLPS
ncbi:uncharacterized protein MONBRDRAFT_30724 [Monosiga brevicollis MX1]|uniref:Uncharacterized protein n=1 Tax=Monosiga brevicollis TaxID=81824 RepID=A9UNT7_MONBE|nr:uncharacterized protein MONBRDRAFT_30724 [Monosiga brevicollis MX1]EDQ92756.1 predicted protein [Monosiga brevicollis MX1]|eukprot:XP_001742518.1 hypothetical protein [Monosiga brevicollis MX1]